MSGNTYPLTQPNKPASKVCIENHPHEAKSFSSPINP